MAHTPIFEKLLNRMNIVTVPQESIQATMEYPKVLQILVEPPSVSLDELLNHLISFQEGITPGEVTVEYIRDQREKRFYPKVRYEIGTDYGGYDLTGLTVKTRNEFDEIERSIETDLTGI